MVSFVLLNSVALLDGVVGYYVVLSSTLMLFNDSSWAGSRSLVGNEMNVFPSVVIS